MLVPSIFGENLFDEWDRMFDFPDFSGVGRQAGHGPQRKPIMRTDVKELKDAYELQIDLPGFKKEDVTAEVKNGYLTITAEKNTSNDEKDSEGKYIRRERYSGTMSRSFYIGENVTEDEIKAKFEDGILKVDVPKDTPQRIEDKRRLVAIEG